MQHLVRMSLLAMMLFTATASFWTLSQNPFAAPLIERSTKEAQAALSRAMVSVVDTPWLEARLRTALLAQDGDKLALYLEMAEDLGVSVSHDLQVETLAFLEAENAFLIQAVDCAACAADIANCQRLSHIASCAIPVEMTPIGDLNALRRASVDWLNGQAVDRLETGLAIAGLGATGLTFASGGTSLTVKAGASLLRLARRLDALTPKFTNTLLGMADIAVDWDEVPDYLLGRIQLEDVADTGKLAAISELAIDLERVRTNTSTAEVLSLMRHVDSAEDAKTLARLSSAQGPKTRYTLEALGKSRTFRLMNRLSDIAILAVGLITTMGLQILSLFGSTLRWILRPSRR